MYVRFGTSEGVTDIEALVSKLDQHLPSVSAQPGFNGVTASADRASGTISVLTSWRTKAEYDASESLSEQARAGALAASGGRALPFRCYEELVLELGDKPPSPGCVLGVTPTTMPTAKIDSNIAHFKAHVLPALRSTAGFRAARNLIDRGTGEGMVGTYWDDEVSLERWMARAATLRSEATTSGIEIDFGKPFSREVIYFHLT